MNIAGRIRRLMRPPMADGECPLQWAIAHRCEDEMGRPTGIPGSCVLGLRARVIHTPVWVTAEEIVREAERRFREESQA